MAVYRSTSEIQLNQWEDFLNFPTTNSYPPREYCTTWRDLDLKDINLWEMIYHVPGGISVYAAWDPYIEFYILVHDLFKNVPAGIEKFYGIDAERKLVDKLQKLGVDLPKNKVWINPDFSWMYEQLTPSNQK